MSDVMRLNSLSPAPGARKNAKRVGRGIGSGNGKTAGRGHKGQKSRSGGKVKPGFEGGQMPLQRRVPKRGFTNIFRTEYQIVNIKNLNQFPADSEVNLETLRSAGLIKKKRVPVKLLGHGELDRPLKIAVHKCTKSAKERVEKAGGQVQIIGS